MTNPADGLCARSLTKHLLGKTPETAEAVTRLRAGDKPYVEQATGSGHADFVIACGKIGCQTQCVMRDVFEKDTSHPGALATLRYHDQRVDDHCIGNPDADLTDADLT